MKPALGVRVHLREVETLDDLADVTAPCPVTPGDLMSTARELYRVEVVLWTPPGSPCVPVLARRLCLSTASPIIEPGACGLRP